ncbi:hypothetical protein BSPWISOXPB_2031 [uncultured Gammaproteobacteria bacterium]|nr:hypothetical protein BSPWISOXPB_2031 [uncultured Gammaproteobacteria bacterium]
MLLLSEVMIAHTELESFEDLVPIIKILPIQAMNDFFVWM